MTPRMVSRLSRQKLTRQGLPPLISLPPPLTGSPKRQRGSSRGCPSLALRALSASPKREQNSRSDPHNDLTTSTTSVRSSHACSGSSQIKPPDCRRWSTVPTIPYTQISQGQSNFVYYISNLIAVPR